MEKLYYFENDKLKLVRYIVTYTEISDTDTLYKESIVTQFLNTDRDLEEIEIILNHKNIEFEVKNIDVSLYEEYENSTISEEEIKNIIDPDIESVRASKLKSLETQYLDKLAQGIEIQLKNEVTERFSCKSEDSQYIQALVNSEVKESYTIYNVDRNEVTVDKEDLDTINKTINEFVINEYNNKNSLISRCNSATEIDEIRSINIE